MLQAEGFSVRVEAGTEAFADPAIRDYSLIVPMLTMTKIEKPEIENLELAIRGGVGLGGFHGQAGDSFRDCVQYQYMIGGQWVAHPGNIYDYTVNIVKPEDPLVSGIGAIWFCLRLLRRGHLYYFAYYTWAAGLAMLAWLHFHGG